MQLPQPFAATCIGSFPHRDEDHVFRLILDRFAEIPFWPQLPKRSPLEEMVLQYSEGFPSFRWEEKEQRFRVDTSAGFEAELENFYKRLEEGRLEDFRITEAHAGGLRILERLQEEGPRKAMKFLKGQVVGPITFGLSILDQEGKPIFYDPTLRDVVVKHLGAKARWMERTFRRLFPETPSMIFFDEPSLSSFGSAFSSLNREEVTRALNDCFEGVDGLKGIHCCGNTDWGLVLETNLDILNFDAYAYMETVSLYPRELGRFLERGGILAWGIVPTSEEILKENVETLAARLQEGMNTLRQRGIAPRLLRQAILTPSCGTASLPPHLSERVCSLTSELSKKLRDEGTRFG